MNILVCDDEKEIVEAIAIYLEQEGYRVLKAYDGYQAMDIIEHNDIGCLIIDIMMPHLDGIHATMEIRKTSAVPVIMLSAKSEDVDKILGLNVGADDYITKPFNPLELVARVKSQIRRYTTLGSVVKPDSNVYINGGLKMDDNTKIVTVDGDEVTLTATEYKILKLFISNPGIVFSSSQIYEKVWNDSAYATDNVISVHIRRIREKIEINPKEPRYIKVMWGIGYKMEKFK
ncbi:MAG: response regulator transcription factor [Lachnospiraceae bacterium]|nr:response regulator transcription factor [Lachnospiraceae bacterium]